VALVALAPQAWAAKDDIDLVSRATGAAEAKANGGVPPVSWTPER
jgi:hypothetical protein